MTELSSQFNCPQCGKPQFSAEFGFEKCFHPTNEIKDPCLYCGESTAPGGMNRADPSDPESIKDMASKIPIMNSKFVNRLPSYETDEETGETKYGYVCADCQETELANVCEKCDERIPFDEDVQDEHGAMYHHSCLPPEKRSGGYGEDCECEDCQKWRK